MARTAQGYFEQTEEQKARALAWAEYKERVKGPGILHGADHARLRAEAEAAAEGARKAEPDPRLLLRQCHELRDQAQADRDHFAQSVSRAREAATGVEWRLRDLQNAAKAADDAAAAKMVAALEAGATPPNNVPTKTNATAIAAADHELGIARAAVQRLEEQLAEAEDMLTRRGYAVSRAAWLVLYGVACDEAQTILAADRQLAIQRADLDGLVQLLTAEGRRLESAPKSVPTSVFHAINPPDRRLTGAARDICRTGASVTTNCALIPRLHHESARCQQYRRQLQSCRVNHL